MTECGQKNTCPKLEENSTDDKELEKSDNIEEQKDKTTEAKEDLYFYTKSGDFTSELFKICVENIPKFVGYQQLKKAFEKMNVEARKIKLDFKSNCAYLTFRSEEEREEAIRKITGYSLKNHVLTAKKAKPKPDPQLKKRQMQHQDYNNSKKPRQDIRNDGDTVDDDLPPEKRLVRVVTDLCDMPYDGQLKLKTDIVKGILKRLTKDLISANAGAWVKENSSKGDERICCPVDEIIPSPVLYNYRNKVEYNIGPGVGNEGATVGFRLGTYKDDNFAVVSPAECINVSKQAKCIAKLFQDYIRQSDRDCYDAGMHTGCWRQLTVRSCCSGDTMVIVQIHPQTMSEGEIACLKSSLKDLFFLDTNNVRVTSLYLQKCGQKQSGENVNETYDHIHGSKTIQENMMEMKFRISPDAFFQVNTPAAEVLYSKVREWCKITDDTTVLDVCCGTGTIGLAIAKNGVKRVVGIELCQQAVDDARYNAEINGVTNVEFICGKAEDFLYNVTKHLHSTDAVAVVDPPRAGLHKRVVLALRQCPAVKRLVYVSCNPKQAAQNFLELIKGDGEVLEEIVSYSRQKQINKQATRGDAASFQRTMGLS